MADTDRVNIIDKEKAEKTDLKDMPPKSKTQFKDREDTLRNIEDLPAKKEADTSDSSDESSSS